MLVHLSWKGCWGRLPIVPNPRPLLRRSAEPAGVTFGLALRDAATSRAIQIALYGRQLDPHPRLAP